MAKVVALVLGAGEGKRMGGRVSKQFREVAGRPLLAYTLDKLQTHLLIKEIIVVVPPGAETYCQEEIVAKYNFSKVKKIVSGGKERQDSVEQGLRVLPQDAEWVVIHDGVRPLVSAEIITEVIHKAQEKGAALVGVPVQDTIKKVQADLQVTKTLAREELWQCQTPQVFKKEIILRAYAKARQMGWRGTDDAVLVEKTGQAVFIVPGSSANLKVTTPEDWLYLKERLVKGG